MPTPRTFRPVFLLLTLAACSTRSPAVDTAAAGVSFTAQPPSRSLKSSLASLKSRTVVDPRPDLPSPRKSDEARPSLQSAPSEGRAPLEFPLQLTRVVADVSGNVARVEVQQLYKNPSADRLEAIYAFPLPANAAVTEMYFRVGKRIVYSEVQQKEEARKTYERAKEDGRTAALTEQERPNLFTQSVANIPPGETVAVVIRYVHEVPFDDGRYAFVFPTTVGPRYLPPSMAGTPEGAAVTPPVVPEGERSAHQLELTVRLSPATAFDDVGARSHRVVSGLDREGRRVVALEDGDRRPNKDFVLSYRPSGQQPEAHALVQREKGDDYLMLFLQPPSVVDPSMVRARELVFLVDVSGSMMGEPLETAKAIIRRSLRSMGPDDTFQILAFAGGVEAMSPTPLPNTPENVARAESWVNGKSGDGGTEMMAGIRSALEPATDPERLRMVIFCTDGFIGNEREILHEVERKRGEARVFGFGIGSSVNRYLLEQLGRAGRGATEIVLRGQDPEEAVARLFRRLDRPVLTDLSLSFEGVQVSDLAPAQLPDLFAGQPLVVVGRASGRGPASVVLRGRLGAAPYQRRLAVDLARADASEPVVGTLWARRRIDDLDIATPWRPDAERVAQIVQLSMRFKLLTQYTSFVAVERELLVDPGLPLTQVLVPNELPEGVKDEGIFGTRDAARVQVTPSRVKPGDPELRIEAPADARAVKVKLPFEPTERSALFDPARRDWVVRFLVPPEIADGSYEVAVQVIWANGETTRSTTAVRVDTTPAAVAVVSSPYGLDAGERFTLQLKPAISLRALGRALLAPAPRHALTAAMEVREILVRAPWGQISRATMHGPLGLYEATLDVPANQRPGRFTLEVVATDAAGNVSRRPLELNVGSPFGREAAAFLALLSLGAIAALAARRKSLAFTSAR